MRSGPDILKRSSLSEYNEALELEFKEITYKVKISKKYRERHGGLAERKILSSIDGVFRPGRLTAIMGSSGAGKTTLLSLLAGNSVKGELSGQVRVNGEMFSGSQLKSISGFVFQDDVLLPYMRVKEAIAMSALLRIPKTVSKQEREQRVNDVIKVLHLQKCANTIVGSPMQKGISGGERKRTAIGMEMVVNPGMLFLDEPTTGLDTFTAYTVMLSLKRLAQQGRTIVSTIHQPSTETFKLFDDLLILSRGQVAYLGPVSEVVAYFAREGYSCPQYTNPADYIFMQVLREFGTTEVESDTDESDLDEVDSDKDQGVIANPWCLRASEKMAAGTGLVPSTIPAPLLTPSQKRANHQRACDRRVEALLKAWRESKEHQNLLEEPRIDRGVSQRSIKSKSPQWTQFKFLFKRALFSMIRNRMLLITKVFTAIFFGLILGLTYLDTNQYSVSVQIRNKSGALYFIAVNTFFQSITAILAIFAVEKQVFYREYNGGYYSVFPYYSTKTFIEIPSQIFGPFLLVLIAYYLIGLSSPFSSYLIVATLAALGALCGNAYGTLVASLVDDINIALIISPLIVLPFILVSGIFIATIPGWVEWFRYLSPIYYSFSGMIQTEFSDPFPNCDPSIERCDGARGFDELEYDPVFSTGVNMAFLGGIFFILWVLGFFALYWGSRRYR